MIHWVLGAKRFCSPMNTIMVRCVVDAKMISRLCTLRRRPPPVTLTSSRRLNAKLSARFQNDPKKSNETVAVRSYQFAFNTWLFYRVISAACFHKKNENCIVATQKKGVKNCWARLEICAGSSAQQYNLCDLLLVRLCSSRMPTKHSTSSRLLVLLLPGYLYRLTLSSAKLHHHEELGLNHLLKNSCKPLISGWKCWVEKCKNDYTYYSTF